MEKISSDFLVEDTEVDNDIDELFFQLEQFQPPADMVERIMNAVAQLPLPPYGRSALEEDQGGFIDYRRGQPS